jgi:hypothetical protein
MTPQEWRSEIVQLAWIGNFEQSWNLIVAGLATPTLMPNPRVRAMANLFWQLVGSRVTPCAMGVPVPTLSFAPAVDKSGKLCSMVIVPENWLGMAMGSTFTQVGAVAYVASMVRDYWSGRIQFPTSGFRDNLQESMVLPMPPASLRLAMAYEAEVMLALRPVLFAKKGPSPYQQTVLARFPNGLAGAADDDYDAPPFDFDRAVAQFRTPNGGELPIRKPTRCPVLG